MKRIAILLLATLLLCALGCKANEPTEDDPNVVFIDPNAVRGGEYGDLYFEANGVRFGIYDEAAAVLSALPKDNGTMTRESCAFDTADVFHTYDSFDIMTNEIDGVARITGINVTSDLIETPQGLRIGMTEEEAGELFPALKEADWNLVDGTALLSVTIVEGKIFSICYTPAPAED